MMERPVKDSTPCSSAKFSCQISGSNQNRSAPTTFSKSGLTPCRRIGLKRKSTPGMIFQSPLKENNSIICGSTPELLTSSVHKNNLFSKTPHSLNRRNELKSPSSEKQEADVTAFSLGDDKSTPRYGAVQTQKTSSTRITTPILSRHGRVVQCSLSKKLKLSSDSSSQRDNQCSKTSLSYLSELTQVLDKNHDSYLELYRDIISGQDKEGGGKNSEKCQVILRMKQVFHQIIELKQSLMNAKQHDIANLEALSERWKDGCQKALVLWLDKLQQQGHKCDMSQLLLNSGIPSELVHYDQDLQEFLT